MQMEEVLGKIAKAQEEKDLSSLEELRSEVDDSDLMVVKLVESTIETLEEKIILDELVEEANVQDRLDKAAHRLSRMEEIETSKASMKALVESYQGSFMKLFEALEIEAEHHGIRWSLAVDMQQKLLDLSFGKKKGPRKGSSSGGRGKFRIDGKLTTVPEAMSLLGLDKKRDGSLLGPGSLVFYTMKTKLGLSRQASESEVMVELREKFPEHTISYNN